MHQSAHDACAHFPGGFMICRAEEPYDILYANPWMARTLGCSDTSEFLQLTRECFLNMVFPSDVENVRWYLQSERHPDHPWNSESISFNPEIFPINGTHLYYRVRKKNGEMIWLEQDENFESDESNGELLYLTIHEADKSAIGQLADHLTGLPGIRTYFRYARRAVKQMQQTHTPVHLQFVYLNFVNFQRYNAKYGVASGNLFLCSFAEILRDVFRNDFIARFSSDHFGILSTAEDLQPALEEVRLRTQDLLGNTSISLKAGIFRMTNENADLAPEVASENSKIACSIIHDDVGRFIQEYDLTVRNKIELQAYITENIDTALEKGYIQVYYQPIVHTISHTLGCFEALARWIDPTYGYLSPGAFIEVLEQNHQIHKLDTYMIQEICRHLRSEMDQKHPVVSISFNLSRLDFVLCDIFQIIEDNVQKYHIPRSMLRIEITESVFSRNPELIKNVLNKFRSNGYTVWMDDFGSGYSSLNLLKDYHFDGIKIDMEFLRNFSEESQEIISSSVRMAKKLHLHTLIEGVETAGHAEFLRRIGCEQMQGFYFGRPIPYQESIRHCIDQNIAIESLEQTHYYDQIGRINLQTEVALSLLEDDGKSSHILYINDAEKALMHQLNINTQEEAEGEINQDNITQMVRGRIRTFLNNIEWKNSPDIETLYLATTDHYLRADFTQIASMRGKRCFSVFLTDITQRDKTQQQLDPLLPALFIQYNNIYIIYPEADYMMTRFQDLFFRKLPGTRYDGLAKQRDAYCKDMIYHDDQQAFLQFSDPETLKERLTQDGRHSLHTVLRTKTLHDEYVWKVHTIVRIPHHKRTIIIYAIRDAITENDPKLAKAVLNMLNCNETATHLLSSDPIPALWQSLITDLPVKLFWKDRQRRFLGASRMFLNYYDLDSADEIIGKTDEDMGWNVDSDNFRRHELEVIGHGRCIYDIPGKCNIRGVTHNIVYTKAPVYLNGKIIGLIGYFLDADLLSLREKNYHQLLTTDLLSGLMNIRGIIDTIVTYNDECRLLGTSFAIGVLHINIYEPVAELYGDEAARRLGKNIASVLRKSCGINVCIGRLSTNVYILLRQAGGGTPDTFDARNMIQRIESIHEIDGDPVTLRTQYEETSIERNHEGQQKTLQFLARLLTEI